MTEHTYEDARERLNWFEARDRTANVAEGCRSLLFEHGRRTERATLLLHGLSASPRQFIAVARALHERGHNVFVPRLPRHGHDNRLSEALSTMNAPQLEACARDALAVARGLGERVFVAGFSLGGVMATYIAQEETVERVVAVSPFLGIAIVPNVFRMSIVRFVLGRRNRFLWWDPFLRDRLLPAHGYPRFATHAVAQGLTLAHEVMEAAAKRPPRTDDLVLVVNPSDFAVNRRAILRLGKRWAVHKPQGVRVVWLRDTPAFVHDIIEPEHYAQASRRVTPVIVELIDGR